MKMQFDRPTSSRFSIPSTAPVVLLLALTAAAPAAAHVELDMPNGGETLAVGSDPTTILAE